MPLGRDGIPLGTQRFHVHSPRTAFRITAVTEDLDMLEGHLRRLLSLTELDAIQWINLNHADIQFKTLGR